MFTEKQCSGPSGCGKLKPLESFSKHTHGLFGRRSVCKECERKRASIWETHNLQKRTAQRRESRRENPEANRINCKRWRNSPQGKDYFVSVAEELAEYRQRWTKQNRERVNLLSAANKRKRRAEDPAYKILDNLRCRVRAALKGESKTDRTENLLGCTIDQFLGHLEINFEPGMTWNNHGTVWEIDHVRPCASFDLTKPEEQRACFHWKNSKPLWKTDNRRKSSKWSGVTHG